MRKMVLFVLVLGMLGCASMVRDGAILRAEDNFADGEFEDVIAIVERAIRSYDYSDEDASKLLYLKSASYARLGDARSSVAILQYIVHRYPQTEYGFRSFSILNSIQERERATDMEI